MAYYRIKAADKHSSVLDSVMDRVYKIASKKEQKDALILVSKLEYAKKDKRLERILGATMFECLVKRRENTVGLADVNVEVHPYKYITTAPYRAHEKTIVVLNPSLSDLAEKFNKLNNHSDFIVVEMHSDGELDEWVKKNQAIEL
ncbi:hypothetical protein [Salmonella enterica]|uniref:hypothetical protein n=1 Tax=Salmonella enterica TaxID=28901 RepID=UPI001D698880|nr:hypothetical protein [Salmonella enterica]EDS7046628.1 hypothetical protein [Salmonella enterica subsp. enterica]EDV3448776.1 hypothetical protein [Salmonella enterica subsp. enterica]EDV9393382.1 hypothetical protein [Salmonella enterica subsp. enterica]MDO3807272.1 hypothetical protein [Salmonella enterica]MDO3818824.1 hypothetical protein [Salmonella enterica]